MVRRRVLVSGRVQGVGFRLTCGREAESRGVTGWVQNRADGRVEAVFEGEEAAVEALVTWCRRGPSFAEVTSVEVKDEQLQSEPSFRVR